MNHALRSRYPIALAIPLVCAVFATTVKAQEPGQKTFATAADASKALYDAGLARDTNTLLMVLGQSAKPLLSSGDEVADRRNVDNFLGRYGQMNRIRREANGDRTLLVGVENWPFPVPLKQTAGGQWYFDTKAGADEILYRRIGNNEFGAIRVCGALAEAQVEYFKGLHDGDTIHQYAQKILSDPGKQNGLYWKTADNEPESPIGPLIADASAEGYKDRGSAFHGYFYRILKSQGPKSYLVGEKMTKGFAFIAYPAEYRNSGVMTFLVDSKGAIYEKDLGPQTLSTASAIASLNLDPTWRKVDAFVEDEAQQAELP